MTEYMLTTTDNPFDPFDQFEQWYSYDRMLARKQGRMDCCSYVAKFAVTSPSFTTEANCVATNEAIDHILMIDPLRNPDNMDEKLYIKVGRELEDITIHRPEWKDLPVEYAEKD